MQNYELTFSGLDQEGNIHTFVVSHSYRLHRDFEEEKFFYYDETGLRKDDVAVSKEVFKDLLGAIDLRKLFIAHMKFTKEGDFQIIDNFSTGAIDLYEGRIAVEEFLDKKFR